MQCSSSSTRRAGEARHGGTRAGCRPGSAWASERQRGGRGGKGARGLSGQTMRTEALFWHLHTQCLHHDTINQANFIKQLKL